MTGPPRGEAAAVRRALLPETVAFAHERSRFWRARLEAAGLRRGGRAAAVAAFERLPPLGKAEAAAAGSDLYASGFDRARDRVVLSSGTRREGRAVLLVRRHPEEEAALERHVAGLARPGGARAPRPGPPIVVELWNAAHGLPPGGPAPGTFRAPWMAHPNFPELALAALEDAMRAGRGRIDAVRGSVSALLALAAAAEARSVRLPRFGVAAVGTTAYELTARARRRIEGAFGAPAFDSYSLSELATPAPECRACGAHHFALPPLLSELFPARDGPRRPLRWRAGAVGRLAVTGLHPFVQRTPLLRYDTGDLVRATGYCAARGDDGFRPLGRAADAVFAPVSGVPRPVVFPTDLFRAADEIEGIARALHPLEQLGVLEPCGLGPPKARARAGLAAGRPVVRVEAAARRGAGASRGRAIAVALRARLLAANAGLRRLLGEGGGFAVRIVAPDDLADGLFKP